jgi:uncharacterized protein (DUF427 family)
VIEFGGQAIADSTRAYRVLETSHPPVYYIPLEDIRSEFLKPSGGSSFCEWKGAARYYSVQVGDRIAEKAAWYYPQPTPEFLPIHNFVAFYAQKMDRCLVDGEEVVPQPGEFYGGWITSEIVGPFKGEPGSAGW